MAQLSDETQVTYVRMHGFTEEAARRRVEVADRVDDCAHALEDVVSTVREFYCLSLDGPFEFADDPRYRGEVSKLDAAWREFQEVIDEAQRIVGAAQ